LIAVPLTPFRSRAQLAAVVLRKAPCRLDGGHQEVPVKPTTFALPLLCLGLIPGCTQGTTSKDTKDAPAKPVASAGAGVARADEARPAPGGKPDDSKAAARESAAAGQDGEAPSEASRKFRKGQPAPRGLSPEDVKAYAEAQGDPRKGEFSLDEALASDEVLADRSKGKLVATFDTTMGKFDCELFEDKAPNTVANFVGLARGVRPSLATDTNEWVDRPFYDGNLFHRVIAGFMIQTGDPTGSGSGGPGYVIVDEFDNSLKHSTKGLLSMANRGPNTGSSQFFVTVAPTPHLDGKHAIFGKCDPEVPVAISKVKVDPRRNDRPYEPVKINTITFTRK
jgi:peptidyl-prolyl cis-trans isomerase A (cyclophilin A)